MSAELKPGYKQTEVGVIPEDWEAARLGDKTTKVGSGITPTGGERVYKQEGRPFLRSQNVGWGTLILDDIAFIDEDTHAKFQDTEIEICDVFLNITGASIGRSAVADCRVKRGNVNQHVCIIRTNQVQLHPRFLNYFLLSTAGQKQIESFQAGGNRQGLNFGQIRSFLIPLPPTKAEQEVIAEALSDADALIESLEQLIAKKRHLKQGAMQWLLSPPETTPMENGKWKMENEEGGTRNSDNSQLSTLHSPFKKRLPGFSGEWITIPFGDVLSRINVKAHQIQASDYQTAGQYPVVDQGKEPVIGYSDRHDKSFRCPEGGVIVFGDHTCIVKFIDFNFLVGADGTQVLRAKSGQHTRFHALQLQHKGISPTGYNRHFKFLKERGFLVPPLPEQFAIAAILSDMDTEIAALKTKLAKARHVKQGMMQELLTGKIRLAKLKMENG